MPRFVFNTINRVIHNADCPHTGRCPVPWPRFGHHEKKACDHCLPGGLPAGVWRRR